MEQLPKIVQERLQATATPEPHPDPDLLTAFAEKSLATREHAQVLAHLAHCADCREIVSLAQVEEQVEVPAIAASAAPARLAWMRGPVLRWGAVAACIAVVAGAVLIRQHRPPAQAVKIASKAPTIALNQDETFSDKVSSRGMTVPGPEGQKEIVAKLERDQQVKLAVSAPAKAAHSVRAQAGAKQELADSTRELKLLNRPAPRPLAALSPSAPPPPSAPSSSAVVVGGQSFPLNKAAKDSKTDIANAGVGSASETVTVVSAAPEMGTSAVMAKTSNAPSTTQTVEVKRDPFRHNASGGLQSRTTEDVSAAAALGARWTTSPDGQVQRSTDGGKTWQPVPVAGQSGFRAVSAYQSDIWAGGDGGLLYHSSDGGAHWTQVKPSFLGTPLTANITHIEFPDTRHGKLTTSNQETWATMDGGATWLKR